MRNAHHHGSSRTIYSYSKRLNNANVQAQIEEELGTSTDRNLGGRAQCKQENLFK